MEPELEKEVQQRFESLPPDVKEAIHSADFTKKLQAIGNGHLLHIDQLTALEEEIMLVMLGFADPDDFSEHVAESVRVSKDTADAITKEVSEQIFLPIRESLQQVHQAPAAELATPQASPDVSASSESATLPSTPIPPAPQPQNLAPAPSPAVPGQMPTSPRPTEASQTPDAPAFPAADTALSQKTVVAPPQKSYTVDPYREPLE